MDLKTYNKKGEEIDNASLINRPNINMPTSSFVEQTVTSLALNGNAY